MSLYRVQRIERDNTPVWELVKAGEDKLGEFYGAELAYQIADLLNVAQIVKAEARKDPPVQNAPSLEGDRV